MVLTVRLVIVETQVQRDQKVALALMVHLDPKETKDQLDLLGLENEETQETRDRRDLLVTQDHLGQMEKPDHKDQQAAVDLMEKTVGQEMLVIEETLEHLEIEVSSSSA